jgi:hypothetical protein
MNKRVFFLVLLPFTTFAGSENNHLGARPTSLAGAFVAIGGSPWSTVYNPAGLSVCRSFEGTMFIIPEQFGLKELRTIGAAATLPFGSATLGVLVDQFGFDLYRERRIAIGFGTPINGGIAVGGALNILRIEIDRYGIATVPSCEFGALLQVLDGLSLGFDWKNVTASRIAGTGESLPQIQSLGMCYAIAVDSRISFELEKDIRFPFSVKTGFEQSFLGALSIRLGVSNNPDLFSCGFGVRLGRYEFSYGGYSHPQLGWTHQIELSFRLEQ